MGAWAGAGGTGGCRKEAMDGRWLWKYSVGATADLLGMEARRKPWPRDPLGLLLRLIMEETQKQWQDHCLEEGNRPEPLFWIYQPQMTHVSKDIPPSHYCKMWPLFRTLNIIDKPQFSDFVPCMEIPGGRTFFPICWWGGKGKTSLVT